MAQQAETIPQALGRMRIAFTTFVAALVMAWLLWQYLNGGVSGHYLLQRKDLPFISNWWSGLLLPALTWILLGRVLKRMRSQSQIDMKRIIALLLGGLLTALSLVISFHYDFKPFLDNVLYLLLLLSVFIPVFYSEFILGFVLGMTYSFGGILPTAFILTVSMPGFVLYSFIRPLLTKVVHASRGQSRTSSN